MFTVDYLRQVGQSPNAFDWSAWWSWRMRRVPA